MSGDLADALISGKEVDDADADVVGRHLEGPGAGGFEAEEAGRGRGRVGGGLQRFDRDTFAIRGEGVVTIPADPRRAGNGTRALCDIELLRPYAGAFEVQLRGAAFEGLAVRDAVL